MRPHLDLSAVEAFVLVADLRSFTHAAEALGLTQAGVSLKLRRLEGAVGRRLLDRTPRQVRLSTDGEAFLPHARTLLAAQELALMTPPEPERELTIAISDHVAGPELPEILAGARLRSRADAESAGQLFAQRHRAVRRRPGRRGRGQAPRQTSRWRAAVRGPVRMVRQRRRQAGRQAAALDHRHRRMRRGRNRDPAPGRGQDPWIDAFLGGGVAAIAAARSGIGVLPLPRRLATAGLVDVGGALALPPCPARRS